MFMERLLLCDARVHAMHINLVEEHDVGDDDYYYGSYCSARVSTLVENMENGSNTLHDYGALFLWDARLGKYNGYMSLMIF
jgi:hypothetical protein